MYHHAPQFLTQDVVQGYRPGHPDAEVPFLRAAIRSKKATILTG